MPIPETTFHTLKYTGVKHIVECNMVDLPSKVNPRGLDHGPIARWKLRAHEINHSPKKALKR